MATGTRGLGSVQLPAPIRRTAAALSVDFSTSARIEISWQPTCCLEALLCGLPLTYSHRRLATKVPRCASGRLPPGAVPDDGFVSQIRVQGTFVASRTPL